MGVTTPVRSLILVAVAAFALAGCHGHLKHGHIPPGQAKKALVHPHYHYHH